MSTETKHNVLTWGALGALFTIVLLAGISIGASQAYGARLERVETRCETVSKEMAGVQASLARIEQKVDDIRNNGHKP